MTHNEVLLYKNNIGISFLSPDSDSFYKNRIHFVIKRNGLHLSTHQFLYFKRLTQMAIVRAQSCRDCPIDRNCPSQLLETPFREISLAFSYEELLQIYDLLNGTSFQLELRDIIDQL